MKVNRAGGMPDWVFSAVKKIAQVDQNVANTMYHNTASALVDRILKEGLKINCPYEKSQGSQWFIPEVYGLNPVFLSLDPGLFKEDNDVTLLVNTDGLSLVTDVPSLTHHGAYYSDNKDSIWFKEGMVPDELSGFDDDGVLYYDNLLDPHSELTRMCINLTKTAACMEPIESSRIRVFKPTVP